MLAPAPGFEFDPGETHGFPVVGASSETLEAEPVRTNRSGSTTLESSKPVNKQCPDPDPLGPVIFWLLGSGSEGNNSDPVYSS